MTILAAFSVAPPAGLSQGIAQVKTAIGAVDAAVAKITGLEPPDPDNVLATDVEAARAHAASWTAILRPGFLALLAGVAQFGKTFDSDYAALMMLVVKLGGNATGAIDDMKALLTKWQVSTASEATEAKAALQGISALEELLQGDARALGADQTTAVASAAAAKTAIAPLQQQIDDTQAKIDVEQAILDSSLFGILVQQYLEHLTGQLSLFSGELDDLHDKLDAAQQSALEAAATAELAGDYVSAMSGAAGAVQSMADGWSTLDANFSDLLLAEDISDFSMFTADEIAAAKADWDNLAQQASGLG